MQANKASKSTMLDLKQWLERPGTSAEASLGDGARQDLRWLEGSKDLSSVTLGPGEESHQANSTKGGGGGFAALFNCAGKRK